MKLVLTAFLLGLIVSPCVLADSGPGFASDGEAETASGGASGGDGPRDGDDDLARLEREIKVSIKPEGAEIESETRSSQHRQKSEIRYQIEGSKLEIELRSFTRDASKQDFKFKWKIGGLVEFVESGANAGFQPAEDTVGTVWTFNKDKFSFSALPDTGAVKNFQGKSDDGVFTVVGHVSGATYSDKGAVVTPGSQKFDILLDLTNFAWSKAGSRIAVVGRLQSATTVTTRVKDANGGTITTNSDRARRIQFGADATPTGSLDWVSNVTVDYAAPPQSWASITASALVIDNDDKEGESENENNKFASFAIEAIRPVKVFWDPSVSVGAGAFSNAASALRAAAPALVALLALLATALARHA